MVWYAAGALLPRSRNESCRTFHDYLKTSPFSPFQNVEILFTRYKFQNSKKKLPNIHAMIKLMWNTMSREQCGNINDSFEHVI